MSVPQKYALPYRSNKPIEIYSEMSRLEKLYISSFKRALSVGLFFSSESVGKKNVYGLSVHWDKKDQEPEVEWLKQNTKIS